MRVISVLALACGLACGSVAAPLLAAGNASGQPAPCDGAGCVPFVAHDVTAGAPCVLSVGYVFGLDKSGKTLVCAYVLQWVPSKPLIGIRTLGAPCAGDPALAHAPDGLAQSPDGTPMGCNGGSWVNDWNELYYAKVDYATAP